VADSIQIVRLKRFSSKQERERHPDWRNPVQLTLEEISQLNDLCPRGPALRVEDFVNADKEGTVMLLAYEAERIIGFMSMTLATLLNRQRLYVNEIHIDHAHQTSAHAKLFEAVRALCEEISPDIEIVVSHLPAPRKPIRSYIGELELAESIDRASDYPKVGEEQDGQPTRRMSVPRKA
jgi:hypothetical protein